LEGGDEGGVGHGLEGGLLINELDVMVVMVVSGGGNGNKGEEFHL